MERTKNVYIKIVALVMMTILSTSCVRIIHQYSPRRATNWKKVAFSDGYYKYHCNSAELGVYPLRTKPTYTQEDGPSLTIDIHNSSGVQATCELTSLWLENTKTGERVSPVKLDAFPYNNKMNLSCYFFFNISENKEVRYNLHFSDKLLGCPIDPIPYVYEKTWEVSPQQLM